LRYLKKYSFYLIFLLYLLLSYGSPRFGGESQIEEDLLQFGHSKDHRPDLLQVKVMQVVLDPLGMPLATDVVSGERADDPLYVPCIARVQASLGRHGLL
jgi:transposase